MRVFPVSRKQWAKNLSIASAKITIFAPVCNDEFVDYEEITLPLIEKITYDSIAPTTPLKAFFFPIKENVVQARKKEKRLIIGTPNCDLEALGLLDKIFLDEQFIDPYYKENRENTVIIGKDCYEFRESCHCTSYDVQPFPKINHDISLSIAGDTFYFVPNTKKGENLLKELGMKEDSSLLDLPASIQDKRKATISKLNENNKNLPDRDKSREGVLKENDELWKKYAATCVSCGACAAICPSCHCFLLIDKKNFEKVKSWDSCQYPAFERVAAGEDPLRKLYERLKNRYLCKFVHKPDMFGEIACTGCGRCIDACIGKISKNEILIEACE